MTKPHQPMSNQQQDTDTTDSRQRDADWGWEGHVHLPQGVPLWKKILESLPELRTGLAYSLVFVSGIVVGTGLSAFIGCKRRKPDV